MEYIPFHRPKEQNGFGRKSASKILIASLIFYPIHLWAIDQLNLKLLSFCRHIVRFEF